MNLLRVTIHPLRNILAGLAFLFFTPALQAQFNDVVVKSYPEFPATWDVPWVLDISGIWHYQCPWEEVPPIIESYTGDTVTIDLGKEQTGVACISTPVPTEFRVLVDMRDVYDSVNGTFEEIGVTVKFNGETAVATTLLGCSSLDECPATHPGATVRPDSGHWNSAELEDQGLMFNRQGAWLSVVPMTFDAEGHTEWMIAGGEIVQNTWFGHLWQFEGGPCLGCDPEDANFMEVEVGTITLVADTEGEAWVKINDGFFLPYQPLNFGYGTVPTVNDPAEMQTDLSGRWAIVEGQALNVVNPFSELAGVANVPLVFDLHRTGDGLYNLLDPTSPETTAVAELVCSLEERCRTNFCSVFQGCSMDVLESNSDAWEVRILSPSRLEITGTDCQLCSPQVSFEIEAHRAD